MGRLHRQGNFQMFPTLHYLELSLEPELYPSLPQALLFEYDFVGMAKSDFTTVP